MDQGPGIPDIAGQGVHIWSPVPGRRRSPELGLPGVVSEVQLLPSEYVSDFARDLKVVKREGRLKVTLPGGAKVFSDLEFDRDRLKVVGIYFNEALDMLFREFGSGKVSSAEAFKAVTYSFRETFVKAATVMGGANAESLYAPRLGEVHFPWVKEHDERWLSRIIFHEAVHAWMDICFGVTGPLWFAEGMAEYFSDFTFSRGITEPGAVPGFVLRALPDNPAPLKVFMSSGRDLFYSMDYRSMYSQAWSVIAFMMETDPSGVVALLNKRQVVLDEWAYSVFYVGLLSLR